MIININYSKNSFFNYLMILLAKQPHIHNSSRSCSIVLAIFDILRKACNLFKILIAVRCDVRNSKLVFANNWADSHISSHSFRFKLIFFKLCAICIVWAWRRTVLASEFWLVFSQELIFIHTVFLVAECWLFFHERVPEIFSFLVYCRCN
jgi:hypothetical protein